MSKVRKPCIFLLFFSVWRMIGVTFDIDSYARGLIDLLHKSPALNGRAVIEQIPACAGIGIRLRTTFFARALRVASASGGGLQG